MVGEDPFQGPETPYSFCFGYSLGPTTWPACCQGTGKGGSRRGQAGKSSAEKYGDGNEEGLNSFDSRY